MKTETEPEKKSFVVKYEVFFLLLSYLLIGLAIYAAYKHFHWRGKVVLKWTGIVFATIYVFGAIMLFIEPKNSENLNADQFSLKDEDDVW